MASVGVARMAGVPALGLPKNTTTVGRNSRPTFSAAAPWSMRAKTVMPCRAMTASSRSSVSTAL